MITNRIQTTARLFIATLALGAVGLGLTAAPSGGSGRPQELCRHHRPRSPAASAATKMSGRTVSNTG